MLIVDFRVPMPDRDAGSFRMLHLLQTLRSRGCGVTLMPDNFSPVQPYTRDLQRQGIEVLYGPIDIIEELHELGADLALAILSRPHQASRWLDVLREAAPHARIVYDTVDLHWLREARRANPAGAGESIALSPRAAALRELELAMVRASDVTLVVSERERGQVLADVPGADVRVIPTVHEVSTDVPGPDTRSGIVFVGGFEHTPNISAAVALVRDIMPRVWSRHPDVSVTIVGGSVPREVEALASQRVTVAGWVPDLEPLLREARVHAAPIAFGAGLKGKITQSLAAGLPVVTTAIGAEGLDATDGVELLIADDPDAFAARVVRVLEDSELWTTLSDAGRALIAESFSLDVMAVRVAELLSDRIPAARPPTAVDLLPQATR